MTIKSLALASLVLAASFGSAYAEEAQADRLPIEQRLSATAAPVVEGRQAAPVATSNLTAAERYVIEHNADQH